MTEVNSASKPRQPWSITCNKSKLKFKVGASMIMICADFKNKTDIQDTSINSNSRTVKGFRNTIKQPRSLIYIQKTS
jgi:hypothetical protein